MGDVYHCLLQRYQECSQNKGHSENKECSQDKAEPNTLVIGDENTPASFIASLANSNVTLITNRKDTHNRGLAHGINTFFSDFNFDELAVQPKYCLYRVSKEKAVCHYIFNQLISRYGNELHLIIAGKKNEGIKSYHQKLCKTLGFTGALKKEGDTYVAELTLAEGAKASSNQLDDKNYPQIRPVEIPNEPVFYSKPGIFGWNKMDKGSEFLLQHSIEDISETSSENLKIVDLGCGYGYLSLGLLDASQQQKLPRISYLHATDNNAAAILCCDKNLNDFTQAAKKAQKQEHNTKLAVSADDCGEAIDEEFNIVISNPPFHQGFENDRELSHKFLSNAARLLSAAGSAYFVVNAFIPLEKLGKEYFANIKPLANNGQFKVVKLQDSRK